MQKYGKRHMGDVIVSSDTRPATLQGQESDASGLIASVQTWLALQVADRCRLQRPDLLCSSLTNFVEKGLTCSAGG